MIKTTDLPNTKVASESEDKEELLRRLIEKQKTLESQSDKRDKNE